MVDNKNITLTNDLIRKYSNDKILIKYIKSKFYRLSQRDSSKLLKLILTYKEIIKPKTFIKSYNTFLKNNITIIHNDIIDKDIIEDIKEFSLKCIFGSEKELTHNEEEILKKADGDDDYTIDTTAYYEKIRNFICDEDGVCTFSFNFNGYKPALIKNINYLQYSEIQILSPGIKFDYPIEYSYVCPVCLSRVTKKPYEVIGSSTRYKCDNYVFYESPEGEQKSRVCNTMVLPDNEISTMKECYFFNIGYNDADGNRFSAGAISFNNVKPGFYDVALFRIPNPKKVELFQLIDFKPEEKKDFELPVQKTEENYIFTLQKFMDKYILEKTGMKIFGLNPIKCAMIIQAAAKYLNQKLIFNTQIVGDASTGKSTIFKYYGFALHNHLNLSTNGLNVSIPGLRGTTQTIQLMGKDQKIITTGYLGIYNIIHIDEAGENKELVQNLKTFLLEDNYAYNKAGATGVFNKRSAQVNVSENLDFIHLGQYRGMIRKAYKEDGIKIGEDEKEKWDESWDLHLPLYKYNDNSYLYKVVKDIREQYYQKHQWWIDGYDYALHERFPFYFYLVTKKESEELSKTVMENSTRETVSEITELTRVLDNNILEKWFKRLNKNIENIDFIKVNEILESYNLHADNRCKTFFYQLAKISCILNKRDKLNEQDYDLVKWFIENTNRKIDVVDTNNYNIEGPPDIESIKAKELQIEEDTKIEKGAFGLLTGEFD